MLNFSVALVDFVPVPSLSRTLSRTPARRWRALGAAAIVVATLTGSPIAATAAPAPPGTTDAAVDPEHLEVLAEQYNLARLNVDRSNASLETTNRRIDTAEARLELIRARARSRAAALYRGTGSGSPLPIGPTTKFADVSRRRTYLHAATRPDQDLLESLSSELDRLDIERDAQRDQRVRLQSHLDTAVRARQRLYALAAQARAAGLQAEADHGADPGAATPSSTPSGVPGSNGTSPTTTTRPASTPTTTPTPTTPAPPSTPPTTPPTGNEPPVSPGAGAAIAFARAQLGKPYVFATAGPNTFDCSGLTKAAWAAGGVRMAHYSGAQAAAFPKVTWDQLEPGDLVFYYSDLHHVGIYIGGGQMIHAPQTGDVVKIAPAWRTTFMFGVRPR